MSGNPEATTGVRGFWRWWPLRFFLFFVILILLYGGGQTAVLFLPPKLSFLPAAAIAIAAAVIAAAILITAYRLLVRWTEHRPAIELRASGATTQLIGGALIGLVLFAGVYGVLWAFGAVTFHGWRDAGGLAGTFALSLLAGVGEELIFRGAVYRYFEDGFGTLIALILSGALFGLIHAANPGATVESSAAIALEAGILLGAAYLLTRSLWLPIGLHFGWNFAEGGIFGAAVSGQKSHGLIDITLSGPQLLTGGAFGPEASIAAVGVCLTAALVMLVFAARRGHWKPLAFRLRTD